MEERNNPVFIFIIIIIKVDIFYVIIKISILMFQNHFLSKFNVTNFSNFKMKFQLITLLNI